MAGHGQVHELLAQELNHPHPGYCEEVNGEAEMGVQPAGSLDPEVVGIFEKERVVVEVGVEELVALSGVVSEQVKDKC